jgi:hypothetical protein
VLVTGAPSIDVVIGATTRKLVYSASNSSSTSLAFKYLLVTGDVDNDGVQLGSVIDLNSGSITDLAINSAALALVNVPSTLGVKVNLPPVGFNDTGTAFEMGGTANGTGGSNASGNLISNDTDNENDLLTVTVIRLGQVEGSGVSGVLGSPLTATYGSLTVKWIKGWFKDTLPVAPIEKLSIMRLDGDYYDSTMDSLTNLYGKLSVGGFVIVDDYGEDTWTNCRAAVHDFRHSQSITDLIIPVDSVCMYWRKS